MSSDKRDITKLIRFNDREYQIVMENANACNMNFSAYVRYAISNIKMPNPDMRKHILKLINEVNHIGNNVNQIVRMQITLKRNASSATAERLFHF